MAFTFIQNNSCSPSTSYPCTSAFVSQPIVGSLLIALVIWNPNGTIQVSDPNNGTWTPIGTPGVATGSLAGFFSQFFYIATAVHAATTVSVTTLTGTQTFVELFIAEYSYTGGVVTIDGTPVYSMVTAVASITTSGTVVTTGASDLVFAASMVEDSNAQFQAPYTARDGVNWNNLNGGIVEDLIGASAGSQVATFHNNGATDTALLGIVAFSTGAAPPVTPVAGYPIDTALLWPSALYADM